MFEDILKKAELCLMKRRLPLVKYKSSKRTFLGTN